MTDKYRTYLMELGFYPSFPQSPDGVSGKEDVTVIEQKLGHSLPEDYRQFLDEFADSCGALLSEDACCPVIIEGVSEYVGNVCFHSTKHLVDLYFQFRDNLESDENYTLSRYLGVRLLRDVQTSANQVGWPEELFPMAHDPGNNEISIAFKGLRSEPFSIGVTLPGGESKTFIWSLIRLMNLYGCSKNRSREAEHHSTSESRLSWAIAERYGIDHRD